MRPKRAFGRLELASVLLFAGLVGNVSDAFAGKGYAVVHDFQGSPTDGGLPYSPLISDQNGNLYGVTNTGGHNYSYGTVYKVAPDGTESLVYTFQPANDAAAPAGRLLLVNGDLYGTSIGGGQTNVGTIFKITSDGHEKIVYQFCRKPKGDICPDGAYPHNGLIADDVGNFYGVTEYGGTKGGGVAFRLAPDGTYTVLHQFCSKTLCADGAYPLAELMRDSAGNIYGTTGNGGGNFDKCPDYACGVVFEIASDGHYKVLYAFKGESDGAFPVGGVVEDASGNLYGTTTGAGYMDCSQLKEGCGTVYKLAPDGKLTVLYAFKGGLDGGQPMGELYRDESGNLYGTSSGPNDGYGFGTVFKLSPTGKERVLHDFCVDDGNCLHGVLPTGGLALVGDTFYGATFTGGKTGWGVVFKLPKK